MELEAISVSQINLYINCSLKYRFQYIDRLPRLFRAGGLVFGSAVHAALDWLHKERKTGRQPTLDTLLRVFQGDWHAQCLDADVHLGGDDSAEKLVFKGKELLSQYYHLPPRPVSESELYFQLPLVNPMTGEVLDLPLRGVIDLVEEGDEVVEFKTSQKSWSLSDIPDNLQLTAYSYAFEMLFGHPPRALRLVNLVRTKNAKIDTQITGREKSDYERLFHVAKEVIRGVRARVFVPDRGCWMCKECEYQVDCLEWTGNEEVEAHAQAAVQ